MCPHTSLRSRRPPQCHMGPLESPEGFSPAPPASLKCPLGATWFSPCVPPVAPHCSVCSPHHCTCLVHPNPPPPPLALCGSVHPHPPLTPRGSVLSITPRGLVRPSVPPHRPAWLNRFLPPIGPTWFSPPVPHAHGSARFPLPLGSAPGRPRAPDPFGKPRPVASSHDPGPASPRPPSVTLARHQSAPEGGRGGSGAARPG